MSNKLKWAPRILAIAFMAFLSLFSFDVFVPGEPIWKIVIAFLAHNIPVIILGAILWLSWKREIVGGVVFLAAGILFLLLSAIGPGEASFEPSQLIISLPAILIGILFKLSWRRQKIIASGKN